MEEQRALDAKAEETVSSSTPVNGKRTIQPKKAFLLAAGGASESDESDDERYANETEEERKDRKD